MANENHDFAAQDDFQVRQKTLLGNEPVKMKQQRKNHYRNCELMCECLCTCAYISVKFFSFTNEESRHQQKIGN